MQGPAAFSFSIFLGLTPCGSQLDLQLPWSPGPNVHLNRGKPGYRTCRCQRWTTRRTPRGCQRWRSTH
ncbi:hypothetical protein PF008_g31745 [Phytophthora fragariae]|uniref:Uncharacterized protein n=1 Tax=Phytophthora fragariae TaxID=53985 RepID=A0A6G0Q1V7_9STRA|nr:hypothetical protein PF008_g31745 [Phytophthora fragariae]